MEAEHSRLSLDIGKRKHELDQLQQERLSAQRQLDEARKLTAQERATAEEQRAVATAAKSEADIARRKRDALHEEASRLREAIQESEERIAALQAEIARLTAQEMALRVSVDRQERELATVLESVAEAKARQAAAESRIAELEAQAVKMRQSIAKLESQVRDLGVEIAKLEATRIGLERDIEALEREIERLKAEKARVEADTKQLTKDLAGMRASATGGSFTLFEATGELLEPQLVHEREAGEWESEEDAVQAVAAHAKSLGFRYPDRVIRAFHTSLKLGRQAPLLVLAGISGTGKSQLPRLYCDALGVNFLPMAVQPGWDSPADLVGFFSHIEHRFKPTPLARALVQMDEHFEQSLDRLPKKELERFTDLRESKEDQLLLVLLDEMNLARVEYYFSDFLSRLELRNAAGFDPSNEENRRRVQLMLEAPGAEDDLKHIAVYPGDNVLFVGTMNEDESTMALSDKVIDRANVLRFGKPENLKAETGGDGDPSEYYLTLEQWRAWTTSTEAARGDTAKVERIAKWTNRLNEALDAVQRAFAHRTAAAIKAYCLAYPRGKLNADAALQHAFADQIEQRVMPKLRGVDPSSPDGQVAMQGVQSLIEDLGDSDLLDAFHRGRRANDEQSFVWFGTRRKADA
jgi:predicted  nucleic acid-binding Zn-ribbon protein